MHSEILVSRKKHREAIFLGSSVLEPYYTSETLNLDIQKLVFGRSFDSLGILLRNLHINLFGHRQPHVSVAGLRRMPLLVYKLKDIQISSNLFKQSCPC
jgi:hypothetical protein